MQDTQSMSAQVKTFVQQPHIFSRVNIKLQSLPDYDSLIFVLNGRKSITLLNWVQAKEIQTWRSGSTVPEISGCISGDKIVILEYEPGVRSAIRTYRMKDTSTNCNNA